VGSYIAKGDPLQVVHDFSMAEVGGVVIREVSCHERAAYICKGAIEARTPARDNISVTGGLATQALQATLRLEGFSALGIHP